MRQLLVPLMFVGLFSYTQPALAGGGPLGLGLVGGDPSGLTLKYKLTQQQALDFRLGLDGFNNNVLLIQGNYLFSLFNLVSTGDFSLPFYLGGGATVVFFDVGQNEFLGIAGRIPIGVAMELTAIPIDIFAEAALGVLLIPDFDIGVEGALGIRYFF